MKMTTQDRLEAIKRTPQYLEYQETLLESCKETDPTKQQAILKKIRFPWDPMEIHYLTLPEGHNFDEIKKILLERFDREAVVVVKEGQGPWGENGPEPNSIWTWNKGRVFIRLSIDLNKSDEELKKCFMEIINSAKEDMYRDKVTNPGISEGRTIRKKREHDLWKIYDLHIKDGLSLLEIARRLSGREPPRGKRTPAYNSPLWPPYKRVETAYKRAVKMIQAVSVEVESWYSEEPAIGSSNILVDV